MSEVVIRGKYHYIVTINLGFVVRLKHSIDKLFINKAVVKNIGGRKYEG